VNWKRNAVRFVKAVGPAAKLVAKTVVSNLCPGGPAVVGLVESVIDCVHETADGAFDLNESTLPDVPTEDLDRVGGILDLLSEDLLGLSAAVQNLPAEMAETLGPQILDQIVANSPDLTEPLARLDGLAADMSALKADTKQILTNQRLGHDMLGEVHEMLASIVSVVQPIAEWRAAGLGGPQIAGKLSEQRGAVRNLFIPGGLPQATQTFESLAESTPGAATPAVGLATGRFLAGDFAGADAAAAEAVRRDPTCPRLQEVRKTTLRRSRAAGTGTGPGTNEFVVKLGETVISDWRLDQIIGVGGMGTVYRATHTSDGTPAALKLMLPALSRDSRLAHRFRQEMMALAGLSHPGHPNLVRFLDFGRDDAANRWFYAMEFVPGRSTALRPR
jgi:hypothetical protein